MRKQKQLHSLEESIFIFSVVALQNIKQKTVCQSVTNHFGKNNKRFIFYSFCKSLNSSHISYFRYVFTFFAGVRITRIRFWHGCKTWFGIAGASTTFLIAIDLLVLIASQFDIPRKKGYTVSFYTGYKMSNIKPGIYNSSNFSSADFNIRINIIGHFHFYVLCHAWRIFCFSKINFSDRSSRKLRN